MEKINSALALKARIACLETELQGRELALKKELQTAQEFLKPANLVRKTVKDLFSSAEIKGNIIDGFLGMVSGYLAKKAVTGSSKNPLKAILGNILQAAVTGQVAEHAAPVRTAAMNFIREFLNKKAKPAS